MYAEEEVWVGNVPQLVGCWAIGAVHHLKVCGWIGDLERRGVTGDHTRLVHSQTLDRHPGNDHHHIARLEVTLQL